LTSCAQVGLRGPATAMHIGSPDGQTVAVTEITSRLWCRGGPM